MKYSHKYFNDLPLSRGFVSRGWIFLFLLKKTIFYKLYVNKFIFDITNKTVIKNNYLSTAIELSCSRISEH